MEAEAMRLIPFRQEWPLTRLQDQMNRLFEGLPFVEDAGTAAEGFVPALDIVDSPEVLVAKVELPGVDPKDIHVSVQDNVLTVTGEKKSETKEEGKNWFRREASYGKFSRAVTLPARVDADRVEASNDAGVLTITLPKSQAAKGRAIPIKSKK
jgi:HSP20 family protein